MRENIGLFKAKRKDNCEWVEGLPIRSHIGFNSRIDTIQYAFGGYITTHKIDPETLCECVGQPDKNNKLIFENDKLRCAVEEPSTGKIYKYFDCIVKYCKTTNAWGWYGIDERGVLNKIPPQQNYIEVIGNKFDK